MTPDAAPSVEAYLRHLKVRGLRPNTLDQAERILRWLRDHLQSDPLDASSFDLEDFLARREHAATRAVEWSYLSGFYRWAVRFDLLDKNPLDRIERPRVRANKPRPMPVDDVARALRLAPERMRPWFYLAAYGGLRSCDIAPLRAEHLLWMDGFLLVPDTKGGGERMIPLPPVVLGVLAGLPKEGWLFPRRDGTDHISAHTLSELAGRFLRKIGAKQTFHGLRHYYGTTALIAAGGNTRIAQELLGHASLQSTQVYTFVSRQELVDTVARLPIVA